MADPIELPPIDVTPPTEEPGGSPGDVPAAPIELPEVVVKPPLPEPGPRLDADAATRAVIIVNGVEYKDWESVYVRCEAAAQFDYFRFSAAEREPLPKAGWTKWQLKPDDACIITLAGQQIINGFIESRQVAYNATAHGIQLIGKAVSVWASKSSVDSEDGNFDGQTFEQVARKVLNPFGVGIEVVGLLNPRPFEKLQCNPGELVWDFLERIARPRGIVLGTNEKGEFVLIGKRPVEQDYVKNELIEGINIKSCQCVIEYPAIFKRYKGRGQAPASDSNSGTAASEITAEVEGTAKHESVIDIPVEQPVPTQEEMKERVLYERQWREGTKINAVITVQGWLADGRELWRPRQHVYVNSPMATLNLVMGIQSVTYTQDNQRGTETTLELVLPEKLNGFRKFDTSD